MKLFIDTSAFVARLDKKDACHDAAIEVFTAIARGIYKYNKLYTSNYVLDESVTHILYRRKRHDHAIQMLDLIVNSRYITMLWVTDDVQNRAILLFRKYTDQILSMTDCTSAVLMNEYGMDTIFTFDGDFNAIGFKIIPE
ncbi:VapC toxin family PIN domain ribonuclease [Methanosarcinales archaeon]|nr:MAG: VapC toxin family PIN domain ribonuclease [Methanosarcinales archaeon]